MLDTSLAFVERWDNELMEEATATLPRRSLQAVFAPFPNSITSTCSLIGWSHTLETAYPPRDSVRCERLIKYDVFTFLSHLVNGFRHFSEILLSSVLPAELLPFQGCRINNSIISV